MIRWFLYKTPYMHFSGITSQCKSYTFVFRELKIKRLYRIMVSSGLTTSVILFIIATANILAWVLASQQVPQKLSAFLLSVNSNPHVILFAVNIFLIVVGMFLETGAAVILLAPILHPALVALGFHPLHVGLVFVLNLSIGLITPLRWVSACSSPARLQRFNWRNWHGPRYHSSVWRSWFSSSSPFSLKSYCSFRRYSVTHETRI